MFLKMLMKAVRNRKAAQKISPSADTGEYLLQSGYQKGLKHGLIAAIVVAALLLVTFLGASSLSSKDQQDPKEQIVKTIRLQLADLGELATQSAYSTIVTSASKDQQFWWGGTVPFTEAKVIFSYDFEVKAGYDFTKVKISQNEEGQWICTLPAPQILSIQIVEDSIQVYDQSTSAFTHITVEDYDSFREEMQQNAIENAIASGIYENAQSNAQRLITVLFQSIVQDDSAGLVFEAEPLEVTDSQSDLNHENEEDSADSENSAAGNEDLKQSEEDKETDKKD